MAPRFSKSEIDFDFCIGGACLVLPIDKAAKEPRFIVEGFASTDLLDVVDDVITLEALKAAKDDLLKNNTVFRDHDRKDVIGSVLDTEFIEGKGLKIRVLISNTRPDIQKLIMENALNKFSIGGMVLQVIKGRHPGSGKPINLIVRIKFHEVSLVSLPANQDARSLSWVLEKSRPLRQQREGGEFKRMDPKKKDEGAPVEGEPVVVTGFGFDEAELAKVAAESQRAQEGAVIVRQVEHLCGLLENGPDDEAATIGSKIKELVSKMGGSKEAGAPAGNSMAEIRKAVQDAVADMVVELGLAGDEPAKGADKAAPATLPQRRIVRSGVRKDAPGGGEAPLDEEAKLKAEFDALPKGKARLKWLAEHGQLFKQLS